MTIMSVLKKILLPLSVFFFLSQTSIASVVLTGSRVIYPENKKFVSLNFNNPDNVPSIMELWVSKLANSSDKDNNTPFVIKPSVFRIDPNKGQSVKLIYTGSDLPTDRESLFYLNFLQLPATKKEINKLEISYKSTVKIFYRPTALKQRIENIGNYLSLKTDRKNSGIITLVNDSEYYVTATGLSFDKNGKSVLSIPKEKLSMIAPFSKLDIKANVGNQINGSVASLRFVNDLGGISTAKIMIK